MKNVSFISIFYFVLLFSLSSFAVVVPSTFELTEKEQTLLNDNKAVFRKNAKEKTGTAVFRVNAPEKKVWEVISNFSAYPEMIPELAVTNYYQENKKQDDRELIYVQFQIKKNIAGINFTRNYYVIHNFPLNRKGFITWKVDEKKKDLNDLQTEGYWLIEPVKDQPGKTQVTYHVKLGLKFMDRIVGGFIMKNGLEGATQWVPKYSEKI